MKKIFLSFSFLLLAIQLYAQSFDKTTSGITTNINGVAIEIQFYNASTVRILKAPQGYSYTKKSLSVIAEPQPVDFAIKQNGDHIRLKSHAIQVDVNTTSGAVSFFTTGGQALFTEKDSGPQFTAVNDAGVNTFKVYQPFVLDADEAIYGLGQLQNGKMVQRNMRKYLIQGNTEDVITFFQSVKGYGVFWDNYSPTLFLDNEKETSFDSEVGDCIDYYFMYSKNADGVIAQMRSLTGEVPMFPLWTYGYWQSKERYKTQNEIVGVVQKYRELGVPLDGIIQDWQYWGNNYLWNAMEFLNGEFYNPQKMLNDIHGMNAHMVISIWSSFGPHTKPYKALNEKGMLFNFKTWPQAGTDTWPPNPDYPSGVRVYDPYYPEARDIYWKHLNQGLFSLGVDGWWMDSTEPDHLDQQAEDMDTQTYLGSFRKVRNAYPLMTVGGVYDHQRATSSDKRVFILTRSAFAGQQRYGSNTWTGDVVSTWEVLGKQIPAGLNFSLCGIPHWNTDIGGFFLWEYPRKLNDPDYRELYTRWLQFGTFTPMMRSHGADAPREIYQFGAKGQPVYDAIEKFIHLRYSLLPYIYSTSWEVSAHQSSMIRALFMDFASDKKVWDINDQYMFGKSLLVCPVIEPMYTKVQVNGKDSIRVEDFSSIKSSKVYLPEGCDWYDFWTHEKQTGGQTINKETPIDIIPLYVRAGSILPIGPKVQYATEKKWDDMELRIYKGANGSFTFYEDEFDNYNYEKGKYTEIPITWKDSSNTLSIGNRKGQYKGMLQQRKFRLVLIEPGSVNPMKEVVYTGKSITVKL